MKIRDYGFECAPTAGLRVGSGMATRCFSLLLGARLMGNGRKRFLARDDALIREITFRHFPEGYTVLNADGGWFDPVQRRFTAEESRQLLVCTDSIPALRRWCQELGRALQQRELLVVRVGTGVMIRVQGPRARRSSSRPAH